MTTRRPASPNSRLRMMRSIAAQRFVRGRRRPRPLCPPRARRPSRRAAGRAARTWRSAASASSKTSKAAVGNARGACRSCFMNAFEPSSRAAARVGPNARNPRGRERVDEPQRERELGPDHDEVRALAAAARSTSPAMSSARTAALRPTDSCPRCPGAVTTSCPPAASAAASACSRAPDPTMTTRLPLPMAAAAVNTVSRRTLDVRRIAVPLECAGPRPAPPGFLANLDPGSVFFERG